MKRKPRKHFTVNIELNGDQAALLELYKREIGCKTDGRAAFVAMLSGLRDFYGTNTDNPDLPELNSINWDNI